MAKGYFIDQLADGSTDVVLKDNGVYVKHDNIKKVDAFSVTDDGKIQIWVAGVLPVPAFYPAKVLAISGSDPNSGGTRTPYQMVELLRPVFPDASRTGSTGGSFSDITGNPNANANLKKQVNPLTVYYLSQRGCTSVDILAGTTSGYADSTAIIQAILDTADDDNPIQVVVDGGYAVSGIHYGSNTEIVGLNRGCGFILLNGANYSVLENRNLSYDPAVLTDKNVLIHNLTINGNSSNNTKASITTGLNCLVRNYGVIDPKIINVHFLSPAGYALHNVNCVNPVVEKCEISLGAGGAINMDGFHADSNCKNFVYRDLICQTADDAMAVNADDQWTIGLIAGYYPTTMSGPVIDGLFENVQLKSQALGARILSGFHRIDNITFRKIYGYTYGYAFIADYYYVAPSNITDPGYGDVGTIILDDWDVDIRGTAGNTYEGTVIIVCNIENLIIRRMKRNYFNVNLPTIIIAGSHTNIQNLEIVDYESTDRENVQVVNHIVIKDNATVNNLKVSGRVIRTGAANGSTLVKVEAGGKVDRVTFDVETSGIDHILDDEGGTVKFIDAKNIVHLNAGSGNASFKTTGTVDRLALGTYTGEAIYDGTFTAKVGAGFTSMDGSGTFAFTGVRHQGNTTGRTVASYSTTDASIILDRGVIHSESADGAYGHLGVLAPTLAASTSGRLIVKAVDGGSNLVGWTAAAGASSYTTWNWGFALANTTDIIVVVGGTLIATGSVWTAGKYYCVFRNGATGHVNIQVSDDGLTSWTNVTGGDYGGTTTTAKLYGKFDAVGNKQNKLFYLQTEGFA